MPAVTETLDTVQSVTEGGYKWGFETDIEMDFAPKGLNEDIDPPDLARRSEPEWLLDWRLKAFAAWQTDGGAALGRGASPADRLPGHPLLRRAEEEARAAESLDEVDPELLKTYEKLGIPLKERAILAGVERGGRRESTIAMDAVFDSVSVATTFRRRWTRPASSSARSARRCATTRNWCSSISARVVPHGGQFLRGAEQRGVHRRQLRLHPEGRALPDGAVHLFPHQCAQHRPVRAHADHRRRGQLRQLSRGLHRAACGTRTSCTRRWWS